MENYINPSLTIDWDELEIDGTKDVYYNGIYRWKSPSNLAIIKYWGKYGNQYPKNPSISLTLSEAFTETEFEFNLIGTMEDEDDWVEFYYDGKKNKAFAQRIENFLRSLEDIFPFIHQFCYTIKSKNSFPHSSGIASSASSMAALALCLCDMEKEYFDSFESDEAFYRKASYIARLGSGSAARSVYGGWVQWGESAINEKFSNDFGTPVSEIHPSFRNMCDSILISSNKEKSVSSSAGHKLMDNNVYSEARYQQAKDRLPILMTALKEGDWDTFGKIAENEALTLHALMMSSEESYILMHPNSLIMIDEIRKFRQETGHHVYFSLDAGPNIHMLYPKNIEAQVRKFINHKLIKLCDNKRIIYDHVGMGPEKLEIDFAFQRAGIQADK